MMTPETNAHENTLHQLRQSNRLLKFGYACLAIAGLTGYAFAQSGAAPNDPNDNEVVIDINKVGDAQQMVGVENPDGFAVLVDEEGKINVVHYDGTVIVPNRKVFSHVFQEERDRSEPRLIELP